jgi:hypothetical protein
MKFKSLQAVFLVVVIILISLAFYISDSEPTIKYSEITDARDKTNTNGDLYREKNTTYRLRLRVDNPTETYIRPHIKIKYDDNCFEFAGDGKHSFDFEPISAENYQQYTLFFRLIDNDYCEGTHKFLIELWKDISWTGGVSRLLLDEEIVEVRLK